MVSFQRFLQTDEYVSVEGNVYKINANKKFLTSSEISPELLTNDRFVGLLALNVDEFSSYNGKALVAVNGIIYDVSSSSYWKKGIHQNKHKAGEELTYEILKLSPHGVKLLERVVPFALLVFTPDQLAKFDGKAKNKAYVSAFGVVYDMSKSKTLKDGSHYGYPAGNELTFEIKQQPGHENMLSRIYPIGLLVFDEKNLARFDGKSVLTFGKTKIYKAFIKVENIIYDVTSTDWQEKLKLDPSAAAGKDYTSDHGDIDALKQFTKVGFGII